MSNKTDKQSLFTKVYKRASKSPFDDHSTILWLAEIVGETGDGLILNYERYIYLHKSSNGAICGISVSKLLLEDNPDFEDRYMDGTLMYAFLLLHIDEICAFCENFQEQFPQVFLLDPKSYFAAAEIFWLSKIENIE